jgi:hypothetical protein
MFSAFSAIVKGHCRRPGILFASEPFDASWPAGDSAGMAKPARRSNPTTEPPRSNTKGLRLHPRLRDEFETFCRQNLLDERSVIEAWMLAFLQAGEQQRREVAQRYDQWIRTHGGRERPGPR